LTLHRRLLRRLNDVRPSRASVINTSASRSGRTGSGCLHRMVDGRLLRQSLPSAPNVAY
jgi:hypothetical protein